ncbi:hypothetical protein EV127DRAFT_131029 [Xylaria flabelliformis]|nr:hypothetical protein EV127DRAFT_131029 [Xylaria flabelliformis]
MLPPISMGSHRRFLTDPPPPTRDAHLFDLEAEASSRYSLTDLLHPPLQGGFLRPKTYHSAQNVLTFIDSARRYVEARRRELHSTGASFIFRLSSNTRLRVIRVSEIDNLERYIEELQRRAIFRLENRSGESLPNISLPSMYGWDNDPSYFISDLDDQHVSILTRRSANWSRPDSVRGPSSALINDFTQYMDAEYEIIRSGESRWNLILPAMHKLECRTGPSITWIDDIRRRADIPCVAWEPSWFEATVKIPDPNAFHKKRSRCIVEDCILLNGHWSSHELPNPCNMNGCSLPRNHTRDHIIIHRKMGSEDSREVDARFARDAKAGEKYWKELADAVLEAMGRPQPENPMESEDLREVDARLARHGEAWERYWQKLADAVLEAMGPSASTKSVMTSPIITPVMKPRPLIMMPPVMKLCSPIMKPAVMKLCSPIIKPAVMKPCTFIASPSLLRKKPLSLYRRYILRDCHIRLFQLDPGTTTSGITGSFICAELSTSSAYIALSY